MAQEANENDIKEYFESYGEVDYVDLKTNWKGRSRRFAFVVFKNVETLNKVLGHEGHMIRGRRVICEKAVRNSANRGGFRSDFGERGRISANRGGLRDGFGPRGRGGFRGGLRGRGGRVADRGGFSGGRRENVVHFHNYA